MPFRYYYDLFYTLTQKEFKVHYKASILGYFWSIISPLMQGVIFFIAFGIFMRFPQENYLLFLLSALYPWQWIVNSLGNAPKVFLSCPALVKKIYFPRFFMPACCVFQGMMHFVFALPVYLVFCLFYGIIPSPWLLLYIPLLLIITYIMTSSLAVILSCLNIFVRDLENLMPLALQMLFFMTPVIYPIDVVPENIRIILYCNPFFTLITSWRSVLLEQTMPWGLLGIAALLAAASFALAIYVYKKCCWKLAELL